MLHESFSGHPFHLHQNHVLITKINGKTLPPEWHDTLDVPKAVCRDDPLCRVPPTKIIDTIPGSITFRTYFNPVTVGCFVGHCHTINHKDIGMMQRFDILPAKGQPSGCMLDNDSAAVPIIERLFANKGTFRICSAPRQSKPVSAGLTSPPNLSSW